nr:relaxase/mobilization nuclease domain-containing protein [Agrobacterium vitis]
MTVSVNLTKKRKIASGKPLRGRPSNRVVFQYSLSWHPTENPSREEMEQGADETLDVLGAANRQAIIFCHTHRENSIIQIVVNRVDVQTGLFLKLFNSMIKLSQWAREWEVRHGTIFTPNRKIALSEKVLQPENE